MSNPPTVRIGLPGLEALLKLRHAELITKLEKEVGDGPSFHAVVVSTSFRGRTSQA